VSAFEQNDCSVVPPSDSRQYHCLDLLARQFRPSWWLGSRLANGPTHPLADEPRPVHALRLGHLAEPLPERRIHAHRDLRGTSAGHTAKRDHPPRVLTRQPWVDSLTGTSGYPPAQQSGPGGAEDTVIRALTPPRRGYEHCGAITATEHLSTL